MNLAVEVTCAPAPTSGCKVTDVPITASSAGLAFHGTCDASLRPRRSTPSRPHGPPGDLSASFPDIESLDDWRDYVALGGDSLTVHMDDTVVTAAGGSGAATGDSGLKAMGLALRR